jgi:predicted CxxxxCH...CXXCH cytochrome family protein
MTTMTTMTTTTMTTEDGVTGLIDPAKKDKVKGCTDCHNTTKLDEVVQPVVPRPANLAVTGHHPTEQGMAARSPGRSPRPMILLLLLPAVALAGCSPSSETGVGFLDAAGNHPAGFVTTHPTFARPDGRACRSCHGGDLRGGISGVSCFTASYNGQGCHVEGPDFVEGPEPFHPGGWSGPAVHGPPAKGTPSGTTGFSYCQICHGTDFSGNAAPTCYTCHTVNAPHPRRPWRAAGPANTHTNVDAGNASVCALCHTLGADSTRQPVPPAPPGTEPGCFNNTLCHGGFVPLEPEPEPEPEPEMHSVPFYDHAAEARDRFADSCSACHRISGAGTGPACRSCHAAADPLRTTNCRSCHGNPPDGSSYPNIAGAHEKHDALPKVTGVCSVCHAGAGSGTQGNHFYNQQVDVKIASTYNAKSGAASYRADGRSCTDVSCHGGQATPDWRRKDAIKVNSECEKCHAFGTAQYNSYSSGRHFLHLFGKNDDDNETVTGLIDPAKKDKVKGCTDCHNTTKLAESHFTALDTPWMEGFASETIAGSGTKIPEGNWNPVTKSCNPSCHGPQTWQ